MKNIIYNRNDIYTPVMIKYYNEIISKLSEEYDISSEVLQHIVNDTTIYNNIIFLYEQIKAKYISDIQLYKDNFNSKYGDILKLCSFDYCGHINTVYENTYISHCNIHKYNHTNITDHKFTLYKIENIVEATYKYGIYTYYNNYINNVFDNIYNYVKYYITYIKSDISKEYVKNMADIEAKFDNVYKYKEKNIDNFTDYINIYLYNID